MPVFTPTFPSAPRKTEAFQVPVQPMANTIPPPRVRTLKYGKACDEERPA